MTNINQQARSKGQRRKFETLTCVYVSLNHRNYRMLSEKNDCIRSPRRLAECLPYRDEPYGSFGA